MGANSTQAVGVSAFLIAFTLIAAGIAGGGILVSLVGVVLLAVSLGLFRKAKPWEEAE
jgi:uncharacterized membrane protein